MTQVKCQPKFDQSFRLLLSALLWLLLALPAASFAIGGSGASSGCESEVMGRIAARGTASELATAIDAEVSRRIQSASASAKPKGIVTEPRFGSSKVAPPLASKPQDMATVRKSVVNMAIACSHPVGARMLDYAAAAGNLENLKYLLVEGADPDAYEPTTGTTVLMRCVDITSSNHVQSPRSIPDRSAQQVQLKLSAYALLLANGASAERKARYGESVFHLCNDPAVLGLLFKAGTKPPVEALYGTGNGPETTAFDLRVYEAVTTGHSLDRQQSVTIAKLLAPHSQTTRLSARTQFALCHSCSGTEMVEECKLLAEFVTVPDKRILVSRGWPQLDRRREHRCNMLLFPEFATTPAGRAIAWDGQ